MKLIIVLISAVIAFAAKPVSTDIPVSTSVADFNPSLVPYSVQSDGVGGYQNGVSGATSILVANAYNHLTWGDWRLDLSGSTMRTVAITFAQANAVQPGDPGYSAPANPPYWGTRYEAVRMENKCTLIGHDMLTMKAGDTFTCPMLIRFPPNPNATFYRLIFDPSDSYDPETQYVQVSCTSTDSGGCKDWLVDPVPVVNPDGTASPGKARAQLDLFSRSNNFIADEGDFYMTFHFHVTRP